VRVALGGGQVRVTRESLHGGRRSVAAKEARHEEVAKVVEAPALEPSARGVALEGLAQAELAPRLPLVRHRDERVGLGLTTSGERAPR
jgi:hypothetical protein